MMLSRSAATALGRMAQRNHVVPAATAGAVRYLNVHEYISMELMQSHGIATPASHVAQTPDEAENIFMNVLNKRKLFNFVLVPAAAAG